MKHFLTFICFGVDAVFLAAEAQIKKKSSATIRDGSFTVMPPGRI